MNRSSDRIHLYLRTAHPATAVDHCVGCHFTAPDDLNLIVTKANVLEIFHVGTHPERPLVLYKHYELHAPVADLQVVRFTGHAGDCLLLAFAEAKVSVLAFDPSVDDLCTVSLHYLEEDFMAEERAKGIPESLRLLVDPGGRCAALWCYRRWLLLLPFTHDEDLLFTDQGKPQRTQPVLEAVRDRLPVGDCVPVDLHALGLERLRDVCFMPGLAEPTLAVLHEQDPTWVGRLASRALSCQVTALALSGLPTSGLQFPVLLRAPHLPHDCQWLVPVSEPVSGVVVVAHNSLVHVSQPRVFGCSVNDYGREELASAPYSVHAARLVADKGPDHATPLCLALQNCRTVVLGPSQVLLALKSGELLSLTFLLHGTTPNAFHFAVGSTTTAVERMCRVGEYLFFGSRLGDSWLVLPVQDSGSDAEGSEGMSSSTPGVDLDAFYSGVKAERGDGSATTAPKPRAEADLQTLFDYFTDRQAEKQRSAATTTGAVFQVRKVDCLLNVGPIVSAALGEGAAAWEAEPSMRVALAKRMARSYWEKLQTLELAVASGTGPTGTIHILQQTVRPTCIKTSQLEAVQGLWALRVAPAAEGPHSDGAGGGAYDTHLLITRARGANSGTMVWRCVGGRLEEVAAEEAGFELRGLTVNAFTLFEGRLTVQVLQRYMAVLRGGERACNVFFVDPDQSPPQLHAHHAELVAPYLVLLTTEGTLLLFTFHALGEQERLLAEMAGREDGRPKSAAFVDMGRKIILTKGLGRITAFTLFQVTDGADRLFGMESGDPSLLCFVWWSSGALEVYTLPDGRSVLLCPDLGNLPDASSHSPTVPGEDPRALHRPEYATELLVRRVGAPHEAPYLLLSLSTGDLVVYSFFRHPHPAGPVAPLAPLRLRKVRHEFLGKSIAAAAPTAAPGGAARPDDDDEWAARVESASLRPQEREFLAVTPCPRALVPFDDVGAYRGVMVCGERPLWLFTLKGHLVAHGMTGVEGAVRAFTPFHVPSCPKGFVDYRVQERAIHINALHGSGPTGHKALDAWWPTARVPLRATPHFIMFHPVYCTYTVVTSSPELHHPRPSELVDPDDAEAHKQMERQYQTYHSRPVPHAVQDRYRVELYSSDTWERLDHLVLDPGEVVIQAKSIQISKEDRSNQIGIDDDEMNLRRRKGTDTTTVQCIGTGFIGDEDLACRGRVLLLDVYPRVSSRRGDRKLLVLYHEPTKGPITAITAFSGYLCLAVSSKLMVYFYDWGTRRLVIASFYDAQFFITSLSSIKNLIVYGDAYRSVYLARWREETRQLCFLGKDFARSEVVSTEVMYEGSQLAMVASDANQNVSVLSFNPEDPQTSQGLWLAPVADVHLDALAPTMIALRAMRAGPLGPHPPIPADKCLTLFATVAGQLGYLLPVAEDKYRRLATLCTKMHTEVPHHCGLHPKARRLFRGERTPTVHPAKSHTATVLDGDLLAEFPLLEAAAQLHVARRAGSRVDALTGILRALDAEFPHF